MAWLQTLVLKGQTVTLEPLGIQHQQQLIDAASDGELWNKWTTSVPAPDTTKNYIRTALDDQTNGLSLAFVVRRNTDNKVVGCTRYCNAEAQHRRLEIGYTWYARSAQRTGVNTEAKLLLLTHAFEALGCIAVEFRTHTFNFQSRKAITRLGARLDGILRNHRILTDDTYRDTVVYSIIESEWPDVKSRLKARLTRA